MTYKLGIMNYWLMKTEPGTYSWGDLVHDKQTEWTGVRNYQARNSMNAMKIGDLVFVYHSANEKQIIGIAKVIREAHADSTDKTGVWTCVDIKAVKTLSRPITLAEIKADSFFTDMVLVNNSRLSVQPVLVKHWKRILKRTHTV